MKLKPQKRLLLHIQNQFYQYFPKTSINIENINLALCGSEQNSPLMIFLLESFKAKQMKKFKTIIYGDTFCSNTQDLIKAFNIQTTTSPPENYQTLSLFSKNALISTYVNQQLKPNYVHIFSLISDQELASQADQLSYPFQPSNYSDFIQKSIHVNYSVPSNLQKSIILNQLNPPPKHPLTTKFTTPINKIPPKLLNSAFSILEPLNLTNKTVLVAFSGGKDSTAAYLTLTALQPYFNYKLEAKLFDPKLPGFSTARVQTVANFFEIPLQIVSKQVIPQDFSLCASCARARRIALLEEKPEFLALGHHLKDSAETILMTGMHNGGFFSLRGVFQPEIGGECGRELVIRPLIYCSQQEILEFTGQFGVEFVSSDAAECDFAAKGGNGEGVVKGSERGRIREFLEGLDYAWFVE